MSKNTKKTTNMKPLKEKNIKEYEEYDNHEKSESDESTEDDNIETTNFYAPRKNVVVGAGKNAEAFLPVETKAPMKKKKKEKEEEIIEFEIQKPKRVMSEKQKLNFQKMNETRLKNQMMKREQKERDIEDLKKLTNKLK